MRLIDADALIELWKGCTFKGDITPIIENASTIEPETTTWIEKEAIYIDEDEPVIEVWQSMKCKKCERYYTTPYAYYLDEPNYCPHCGRKTERRTDEVYHRV